MAGYPGEFHPENETLHPTKAVVVSIDSTTYTVACWMSDESILAGIPLYGSLTQELGKIQVPEIIMEAVKNNKPIGTYFEKEEVKTSMRNMAEALLIPLSERPYYACIGFRPFNPEKSPLLKRSMPGRTLERFDDGSYYVIDKNGQSEFVHVSGIRMKFAHQSDGVEQVIPAEELPTFEDNKNKFNDQDSFVMINHPAGNSVQIGKMKTEVKQGEEVSVVLDSENKAINLKATGVEMQIADGKVNIV